MALATLHTGGGGYWSHTEAAVDIVRLSVVYVNDANDFGELRVYFDPATWDVNKVGLIYTDSLFIGELREFLTSLDLKAKKVRYSEQGMQGNNYVSCDVSEEFLHSWERKYSGIVV